VEFLADAVATKNHIKQFDIAITIYKPQRNIRFSNAKSLVIYTDSALKNLKIASYHWFFAKILYRLDRGVAQIVHNKKS
jgi:hypothetical protein